MKIGIDLGGSHVGIALISNENKIIEKIEIPIEKNINTELEILNIIDSYINKFKENNQIELIGIVGPGKPDKEKLTITNIVNLGIKELDFKGLFEKYKVEIDIKNDAKSAGMAEYKYGALKPYKDAVFLCLGTGIGSAVFLNGQELKNKKNNGFELGHMIIQKDGNMCNCGKRGCFETYCSIKRFKDNVKDILNLGNISSEKILEKIKENIKDNKINNLIEEFINNLIIGLSNIIDIFEPEAICFGGSFVFFKEIFYEKLVKEMDLRKYKFNKDSMPDILLSEFKNDAGLIGAVIVDKN